MNVDEVRAQGTVTKEGHLEIIGKTGSKYVFWAGSCGDAECDCRDIILYPVLEESVKDALLEDIEELRIDPDTAQIHDDEGEELDPTAAPLLEALADSMTGDVLDKLVRRWHEDKGRPIVEGRRAEFLGLEEWELEDPVAWEQVFETIRMEDFSIDGTLYSAMELYSANPGADTADITLDFAETSEDEDEEDLPIGEVTLRANGGMELSHEEGEEETLHALWAAYQKRYPTRGHLRRRAEAMRSVGLELLQRRKKK